MHVLVQIFNVLVCRVHLYYLFCHRAIFLSSMSPAESHVIRLPCKSYARFNEFTRDVLLKGIVIDAFDFFELSNCKEECILNANCKSFNYNHSGNNTCQLMANTPEIFQNQFYVKTGWSFYVTSKVRFRLTIY